MILNVTCIENGKNDGSRGSLVACRHDHVSMHHGSEYSHSCMSGAISFAHA